MTDNKNIDAINKIHFIGIGGIGMSAVARYFHALGKQVSGYDRTETALTKELAASGIQISYTDDGNVPRDVDLVVYTPAIPKDHKGLVYYQDHDYKVVKRSDVLQLITESSFNICIAGTHGKTTTTTMVAHILRDSGYGCNAFLGGISANYNTNFWAQTPVGSGERNVCVIEADEYDRSFLKLSPDVAIITSVDADHLDIYGTEENVKQAFADFAGRIKTGGLLVKKLGLGSNIKSEQTCTYSLQNDAATAYAADIELREGGYVFTAVLKDQQIEGIRLNMGGMHNVENMMAAIAVANALQIDAEKIKAAVASFKGVKRRFEYIIPPAQGGEGIGVRQPIFIDDYAHHPQELKALINGVKTLFAQRKCTVIFQPHLYSRTNDFADDFARVLNEVDELILLPIYPARELPVEGVNSEMIIKKMMNISNRSIPKQVMSKEAVLQWVANDFAVNCNKEFGEVLVIAGAGDIDKLVEPIKQILEKN